MSQPHKPFVIWLASSEKIGGEAKAVSTKDTHAGTIQDRYLLRFATAEEARECLESIRGELAGYRPRVVNLDRLSLEDGGGS